MRGFTDLGTYVNKPGDHGIGPPCFAFDLGRKDRFLFKGWDYLKALAPRSGTVVAHKLSAKRLARKASGASRRQWRKLGAEQRANMLLITLDAIHKRGLSSAVPIPYSRRNAP